MYLCDIEMIFFIISQISVLSESEVIFTGCFRTKGQHILWEMISFIELYLKVKLYLTDLYTCTLRVGAFRFAIVRPFVRPPVHKYIQTVK